MSDPANETSSSLLDRIPLLRFLRGYRFADFRKDLKAGINVALLDFPQGMAYALSLIHI